MPAKLALRRKLKKWSADFGAAAAPLLHFGDS